MIFDQLLVSFNQLHMLLFPSVVFDIRSVVSFIQSVACYFFDQLCLIFDQLLVSFNQLYMLLFPSVVFDIQSVVSFIQSVAYVTFSISSV